MRLLVRSRCDLFCGGMRTVEGPWANQGASLLQPMACHSQLHSSKASWGLLPGTSFCSYFQGRGGVEVGRRDRRGNVFPFVFSLCHLLVVQGVGGSLLPEMCRTWYGGSCVFMLLHAAIAEVPAMPTLEMQREIVVSFI